MPTIAADVKRRQVDYECELSIECMARPWALMLLLLLFK